MFTQRYGKHVRPEDFLPFVGAGENRYLGGVAEKYGISLSMPAETFDAYVTGSEIKHKKPHPEGFLKAAQKLSVSPEYCLVIEDAPNGIKAAQAAGMHAMGLTTSFDKAVLLDAGAEWVAIDLAHAPPGIFESSAWCLTHRL